MYFKDEFAFLSTFFDLKSYTRVKLCTIHCRQCKKDGMKMETHQRAICFNTVECALLASIAGEERAQLPLVTMNPAEAQKYTMSWKMSSEWLAKRVDILAALERQKFSDPTLMRWLLSIEDTQIVEENWRGETFWGTHNGKGNNHHGKILTSLRNQLAEKFPHRRGYERCRITVDDYATKNSILALMHKEGNDCIVTGSNVVVTLCPKGTAKSVQKRLLQLIDTGVMPY